MKIVPAILTNQREKFLEMLEASEKFADYIQIDIMDGKFVPSRSISCQELKDIKTSVESEAHLMVENPYSWLAYFRDFGAKKIVYHYEINIKHLDLICAIRKYGFGVGIAINPQTEIAEFAYLVEDVDSVLFMSVEPGYYGSEFIPQVLDKIKRFKEKFPNKCIGIDGGIKLGNIGEVVRLGVDYICVGSGIFKATSWINAYREFVEVVRNE